MTRRIRSIMLFIIVLLQVIGHPPKMEITGWDYCSEEGHPFTVYKYTFGFPIPIKIVRVIYGCLTTPHIETITDHNARFYDLAFMVSAIWIIFKIPVRARMVDE